MPWNDNAGGGGGGPWGSGGNGGGNRNNPWGQNNGGGGGGGGRGGQEPPDLDELVGKLQDGLRGLFGGGSGGSGGGGKSGKGGGVFGGVLIALIVGFVLVIWPGRAVYTVDPDEVGVVLRFGEHVRTAPSGLNFKLPSPIENVEFTQVTQTNTIEIGGSRDQREMLTRDENIVDIAFTVQWRVDTANIGNYVFNVRNQNETVRAVAESAMREVVGTSDLVPIITTGRAEVSQRTRELMQATLDEYEAGILVLQVNLQTAQAPEAVIEAFRDVDAAAQDAERVRLEATAYANSQIPEARGSAARILAQARGYRDAVIAEAQGQADRFVAIYDQYALAPEVTRRRMYLETMEEVLGNSELMILDQDGSAVPYLSLDELRRNRSGQGGR